MDEIGKVYEGKAKHQFDYNPRLVVVQPQQLETGENFPVVVALAETVEEAMSYVNEIYGVSIENLKMEYGQPQIWGANDVVGVCYVTRDAEAMDVVYGMKHLAEIGYDLQSVIDSYFQI